MWKDRKMFSLEYQHLPRCDAVSFGPALPQVKLNSFDTENNEFHL